MMSDETRDFKAFFTDATGFTPYEWQVRVATEGIPEVLPVPTGLGKTEGAVLAWAWRRLAAAHDDEPLHLVYCLPMRTLVRQTVERLTRYFAALESNRGIAVRVHQLMGGALDDEWVRWPDKPWVLVGTQDQLLSRALNRGYAMSRFEWPIHFGLLNHDCRWIVDEVQLMGPGLWTTAQLDWMRQKRFRKIKPCRTTWMSATVGTGFLATIDRKKDGIGAPVPFDPRIDKDRNEELQRRRTAKRPVKWVRLSTAQGCEPVPEQIAAAAHRAHLKGTLTLVVCNTVETAQQVFRAVPETTPKILLTSRFRRQDRSQHEQRLLEFEAKRAENARCDDGSAEDRDDPGLICVSTQVIEAGVDVSAHQLWSELAPWPSVIQRLGRLNRDGRDNDTGACAHFWRTPQNNRRNSQVTIGPYDKIDIGRAVTLLSALSAVSANQPFSSAVAVVTEENSRLVSESLQPAPAPLVRAIDVHGLFSSERDVHGGFTDISAFVRGTDPDADVTVFWRVWNGVVPPHGEGLDGPALDVTEEGCPVAFTKLRDFLKTRRVPAWTWNDEDEHWERVRPEDLRPGMVAMLRRDTGGYDSQVGWTGSPSDVLDDAPRAGHGRALRDDERAEMEYWARVEVHLQDARNEAVQICDTLEMRDGDDGLRPYRVSVVEGAALHDIGKVHPKWQRALPADYSLVSGYAGAPLAKFPKVLAIDGSCDADAILRAVAVLRPHAVGLPAVPHRKHGTRFRWAIERKLSRSELDMLCAIPGVRWAGHAAFRPDMRHEAASALAMWRLYREAEPYPALAVYLVAAHHGKVRTVLRATSRKADDVFGVERVSEALDVSGKKWPLDFSVAADGAAGNWSEGQFLLTDHGWTGLVADLLGSWRSQRDDASNVGAVPEHEPRQLGPFLLAWLEALLRVADWRASERPSESRTPSEVSSGF